MFKHAETQLSYTSTIYKATGGPLNYLWSNNTDTTNTDNVQNIGHGITADTQTHTWASRQKSQLRIKIDILHVIKTNMLQFPCNNIFHNRILNNKHVP